MVFSCTFSSYIYIYSCLAYIIIITVIALNFINFWFFGFKYFVFCIVQYIFEVIISWWNCDIILVFQNFWDFLIYLWNESNSWSVFIFWTFGSNLIIFRRFLSRICFLIKFKKIYFSYLLSFAMYIIVFRFIFNVICSSKYLSIYELCCSSQPFYVSNYNLNYYGCICKCVFYFYIIRILIFR